MTLRGHLHDFGGISRALLDDISLLGSNVPPKRALRVPRRKLELPKVSKKSSFWVPQMIQNRSKIDFGTHRVHEPTFS